MLVHQSRREHFDDKEDNSTLRIVRIDHKVVVNSEPVSAASVTSTPRRALADLLKASSPSDGNETFHDPEGTFADVNAPMRVKVRASMPTVETKLWAWTHHQERVHRVAATQRTVAIDLAIASLS